MYKQAALTCFLALIAGCSNGPSYLERLEEIHRFAIDYVCPCNVADGLFDTESACREARQTETQMVRSCMIPIYATVSVGERGILDCSADRQEEVNACLAAGVCSDQGIDERCYGLVDFDSCGDVGSETLARIENCLQ